MLRRFHLFLFAVLLTVPAVAQMCDLSMQVSCTPGQGGSVCTATTTNNGAACRGYIFSGWFASGETEAIRFGTPETSLHLACFGSDEWDSGLAICYTEDGLIGAGTQFTSTVAVTGGENIPLMAMTWVGDMETGAEYGSAYAFTNAETQTCTPIVSAPPVVPSGLEYTVSWSAVSDPTAQYIVEEAGNPEFTGNVTSRPVAGLSTKFLHANMATATTYCYRVRPTHCAGGTPTPSQVTQTVVQAEVVATTRNAEVVVPAGSTGEVFFDIKVPPPAGISAASTVTYTASMDKPFLGVNPKTGVFPAEGLTLKITARPGSLPVGASTGTLSISFQEQNANGVVTNAGAPMNIPVSISLVTPVAPGKKTLPPTNAVIIPVVTHVNGASAPFLSDVRLTNAGGAATQYQVTMTSTRDGVTTSKVTQVNAGDSSTIALNDVVRNFFGFGATGVSTDVEPYVRDHRSRYVRAVHRRGAVRPFRDAAGRHSASGRARRAPVFDSFLPARLAGLPLPHEPRAHGRRWRAGRYSRSLLRSPRSAAQGSAAPSGPGSDESVRDCVPSIRHDQFREWTN